MYKNSNMAPKLEGNKAKDMNYLYLNHDVISFVLFPLA